jgi:peptide/nickel transport system substrate-binding protein
MSGSLKLQHLTNPLFSKADKVSEGLWRALAVVRDVQVVDKSTVDYITAVPNRPLLRALSSQTTLSPRALQELGPKIATNPVGTGPYKFIEYVPGQHLLMEVNPNYWGPKPKSQRLKIRFLPENGTRVAALESGEVMLITNVPPDTIKRLKSNPQLEMRTAVTNRIMLVNLRTDRPPWNDKRARQALNYAIDKEAITEGILGGLAPSARAPLAPALLGSHPGLQPYPYDPEKAKKLLAAAGAIGGAVITETVFAWPGMGMVTVTAIHQRDYPVVQSAVLVLAVLVVLINWCVDIVYHYLERVA